MRGTKAKAIRRKVYGNYSIRNRGYYIAPGVPEGEYGQIICDQMRHLYQKSKKLFKTLNRKEKGLAGNK